MRKYRRFVRNPEDSGTPAQRQAVRNSAPNVAPRPLEPSVAPALRIALRFPSTTAVMVPSRNGGGFWLILSETRRNHRHFLRAAASPDLQAFESIDGNRRGLGARANAAEWEIAWAAIRPPSLQVLRSGT